ncbi:hypothetical protein Pan258_33140 [Symmachiella dynata]|nr:hypothetical protein Pan258_33140 [Symmachiella dynata]
MAMPVRENNNDPRFQAYQLEPNRESPKRYCLLPTAYCLLPTAYRLPPTAYRLLPTAYRPSEDRGSSGGIL